MDKSMSVPLFGMCMCLSNALDLVSPDVVDHHKRVAYIATCIAREIGLSEASQEDLIMAGLLHDIGAITLKDRIDALKFEVDQPGDHAELGYRLVRTFDQFARISQLVRFHHYSWNNGEGESFADEPVPVTCHVLHLADRIAALANMNEEILSQSPGITVKIREGIGDKFVPYLVDAYMQLSSRESFWFDLISPSINRILKSRSRQITVELNPGSLLDLSRLFSRIIDFRSRFTATHSSGVSAVAKALGRFAGLNAQECRKLRIAGYLHDLGKLAVAAEILEKPGKLDRQELYVIKKHTYYTYWILKEVPELDVINIWASLHHECIDGSGYPFHCAGDAIPLGSRIVAVADIFTALSEDRPYRAGMSRQKSLSIIEDLSRRRKLDGDVAAILVRNYDEINSVRLSMQREESKEYAAFRKGIGET